MEYPAWPELPYQDWSATKKTLHMCAQMLGKTRLALAPPQPEWLNACLYLSPRGLTTGAMPLGDRVISGSIDLFESAMKLESSDGRLGMVPLGASQCVAELWAAYLDVLADLGVRPVIWEQPQEVEDATLFSENYHDCVVDQGHALAFHRLLCTVDGLFEEFRSRLFGRTGVQFWWGSFDFSVLLFTGRHLDSPDDRGYIMRYDLDAEHLNAGVWFGDDNSPQPIFYGYLVPRPADCAGAPIRPEYADWVEAMGEWIMAYDDVRTCDDPPRALTAFLDSLFEIAVSRGAWDAEALSYRQPPRPGEARS